MSGAVCGMRMAEAMASMPAGCDLEIVRPLLMIAEVEFVSAANAIAAEQRDLDKGKSKDG